MATTLKDRKRPIITSSNKSDVLKKAKTESASKLTERDIFYLEDVASEKREAATDLCTFLAHTSAIRESLTAVKNLKESGDKTAIAEIVENRILSSLHIGKLRKLNRLSHLGCAKAKDTTLEKRNKIDEYHLRLQNLLYEITHLQKEISKCLDFRSKDEDLKLVPVDEFYANAPEELSRPDVTQANEHEQRKARLQWELAQRKKLASELSEANTTTAEMQADIQAREVQMNSLLGKLNTVLQSTTPVQEFLSLPYDKKREQLQAAKLLPRPLYVMYRNLIAYQTHSTSKGCLEAQIMGDLDAAKAYISSQQDSQDVDSDSDQEEEGKPRKSGHRRRLTSHIEDDLLTSVLKKHPLYICVDVMCKIKGREKPVNAQLCFYYLTKLEIVSVKCSIDQSVSSGCLCGGDLLQADSIMKNLVTGDLGGQSPNPSSQYDLSKLGHSELKEFNRSVGQPFMWAQTMAGLSFVSNVGDQPLLGNVRSIIEKLQGSVNIRVSLTSLLSELEKCQLRLPVGTDHLFPSYPPTSTIRAVVRSTVEELKMLPHAADVMNSDLVDRQSLVFNARLACNTYRMNVSFIVSWDYPEKCPFFLLEIEDSSGSKSTRLNNEQILTIEREINCNTDELILTSQQNQLLSVQMRKLAWCFDVYVSEMHQNAAIVKTLPNTHSGPSRSLPLKFDQRTGFFIHH